MGAHGEAPADPVLALLARGKERVRASWCKNTMIKTDGSVCVRGGLCAPERYAGDPVHEAWMNFRASVTVRAADALLNDAAVLVGDTWGDGEAHVALNNDRKTKKRHVLGLYDWAMWLRRREIGDV